MSYGSFATYVHPTQRYGMIFGASPKGMQMDIDQILFQAVSKDNSTEELKGFILSQKPRESANEHLVPEQLFDDPKTREKEAEGISAVKALQIASSQGQTIYTVTKANYAEILPKINHSTDVMTDVKNAINAGKEVTISQTQVHAFGWSGTGYIVLDPESGVGGYLIGGGADGGILLASSPTQQNDTVNLWFYGFFSGIVMAGVTVVMVKNPLLSLIGFIALAIIVLAGINAEVLRENDEQGFKCFANGFSAGYGIARFILGGFTPDSFVPTIISFFLTGGFQTANKCLNP